MVKKRIVWHLEVPKHLDDELERYICHPKSNYKTKSEFIRDAVRKKLNAIKRD